MLPQKLHSLEIFGFTTALIPIRAPSRCRIGRTRLPFLSPRMGPFFHGFKRAVSIEWAGLVVVTARPASHIL